MMSVGDVSECTNNSDLEREQMKRIIATSVMGAFLLTAPAVFASDKAPVDASAKGSVKTEAAPVVKKPETAATAATAVPSAALKQEVAAPAKADTVKSADKAAVKTDAAKPEADKAAAKAEAPKADAAKAADKSAPAKAATLDVKAAKPEAKPEAKPVTMKPAEAVKHTAETAPVVKKPETAAVKAN